MTLAQVTLAMVGGLLVVTAWLFRRTFRDHHTPDVVHHEPPAPPKPVEPTIGDKMLIAINEFRRSHGKHELRQNKLLLKDARDHSDWQAQHKKMGHFTADGSPGKRLDLVGYHYRGYGENVAWNQPTIEAVMTAWAWSPGHRINMLSGNTEFGGWGTDIGGGYYWTQCFGTPAAAGMVYGTADEETRDEETRDEETRDEEPHVEAPVGRLVREVNVLRGD